MTVQVAAEPERLAHVDRRGFPWLRLAILSLAAMVFVAAVAEISLRFGELRASNLAGLQCIGTSTLLQGQKGLYVLDPDAGYRMRPDTCVRLRSSEYDGVLRTNSRGLVGPEVSATKPADEFRVVVLGDSFAVGGQVPYEATFPAVLERRLRANGYSHVRVINAGVGGYSTFNEAGLLREHMAWLQPDLVVVAAFLGNDVEENVLATAAGYRDAPEHPKGVTWGAGAARLVDDSGSWFPRNGIPASNIPPPWSPNDALPTAVGNHGSNGVLASVPAQTPSTWEVVRRWAHATWDGARTYSLVLGKLFGEPIDPSVSTSPGSAPLAVEQKRLNLTSFEWTILREMPRTYWLDVAWPLFGRYLGDIRDTATAGGARVVVLVIPDMAQVDERMHARAMLEFRFRDDEVDWERPQRDMQLEADRAGLAVLDLLPIFRARPDREHLYLSLDTHFTPLGHAATAEALATFLANDGWLP